MTISVPEPSQFPVQTDPYEICCECGRDIPLNELKDHVCYGLETFETDQKYLIQDNFWNIIKSHTQLSKNDIYYGFCANCSYNFVNGLCPCRLRHIINKCQLETHKNDIRILYNDDLENLKEAEK